MTTEKYDWLRKAAPEGAVVRELSDRAIETVDRLARAKAREWKLPAHQIVSILLGFEDVPQPPKRLPPFFTEELQDKLRAKLELERARAGDRDEYPGSQWAWVLTLGADELEAFNRDLNSPDRRSRRSARDLRLALMKFLAIQDKD